MKRIRIEIIFLIVLGGILTVLYFNTTVHKLEYISGPPGYMIILMAMLLGYFAFNHFVLKQRIRINIIYSVLTYLISTIISVRIFVLIMDYLERMDQQMTPLGWQYNYKWYELLIVGLLLVISTELIGKKLRKSA